MSLISLIASRGYISVNKRLINEIGLEPALLIGELASEYDYFEEQGMLDENKFYSTVENIKQNTGLSEYQQRQAFKILQEYQIVKIYKKGLPAKRFIEINEEALVELVKHKCFKNLSTIPEKIKAQEAEFFEVNKNNKTKINNNNNIDICINKWNALPDAIPKVKRLTTSRKSKLNARLNDFGIEELIKAIDLIKQSSFLKGQNKNGWVISFDWFLEPKNITKILEGNFKDRNPRNLECFPSYNINEIQEASLLDPIEQARLKILKKASIFESRSIDEIVNETAEEFLLSQTDIKKLKEEFI